MRIYKQKLSNPVREKSLNGANGVKKKISKFLKPAITVIISVLIIFSVVKAGSITPPSGTPTATMYTFTDVYRKLTENDTFNATKNDPNSFTFSDALNGTHYTLENIYEEIPNIEPSKLLDDTTYLGVTGTIAIRDNVSGADGSKSFSIPDGYYSSKTATANDSDLVEGNILSGKTIFGVDGTLTSGPDYSEQSLVEKDDAATGDAEGEESTWTNSCPVASEYCSEDVYKDERTGLYWSSSQGAADNNNFTISTCSFFSTEPRGDYDGLDSDCGDDPDPYNLNAINMCGLLSIDSNDDGVDETDWYLPSQKELQQAYIDGMYNKTDPTFTATAGFWSPTEYSDTALSAWYVRLNSGYATYFSKTSGLVSARCVRR